MHFNCRNLNGTVFLQSLTTLCWLYTWEQTNSSNKFAANLNMKGISFFLLTLYTPYILMTHLHELLKVHLSSKGRVNSNSRIINTDEDPSLRIESFAIINLRGVSTKLNKYIDFTMQTYKELIK